MKFDPYHIWLGIPPAEQPPNDYRLLGLQFRETNPLVISNASDRQMAHVRNYQSGQHMAEASQLLNELAAATCRLLNSSPSMVPFPTEAAVPASVRPVEMPSEVSFGMPIYSAVTYFCHPAPAIEPDAPPIAPSAHESTPIISPRKQRRSQIAEWQENPIVICVAVVTGGLTGIYLGAMLLRAVFGFEFDWPTDPK